MQYLPKKMNDERKATIEVGKRLARGDTRTESGLLLQETIFSNARTSSTSLAERNDPSPSLFSSTNGGNSHSINGNEGDFGLLIAALTDSIACLSLLIVSGSVLKRHETFEKNKSRL